MRTEFEEKVTSSLVAGRLPCPIAFKIAKESKVSLREIGETADKLGIRIVDCQLGFFGTRKTSRQNLNDMEIKKTVVEEIETSLVNGKLLCPVALEIARKVKVAPKEVGDTATKQRIKISTCQLGCFS